MMKSIVVIYGVFFYIGFDFYIVWEVGFIVFILYVRRRGFEIVICLRLRLVVDFISF